MENLQQQQQQPQQLHSDRGLKLKSGRKPLQPKNCSPLPTPTIARKQKEKQTVEAPGKNARMAGSGAVALEVSLAEELSGMRKRAERLRMEREKTEKLLKQRDWVLDMYVMEIQKRCEVQNMMELQVDGLFRFKELHSYYASLRVSPIPSLREKQRENKAKSIQQEIDAEEIGESVGGG